MYLPRVLFSLPQNNSYFYIDIVSTASAVVYGNVYVGIDYSPYPTVGTAKVKYTEWPKKNGTAYVR